MVHLISKDALVAEIDNRIKEYILLQEKPEMSVLEKELWGTIDCLNSIKGYIINTLEVKEVDISNISENLAEADEYLDYTTTGNLAHNKPMVSARLKRAIQGLFDAGLFELTHDIKYRMEKLGLKTQKGE